MFIIIYFTSLLFLRSTTGHSYEYLILFQVTEQQITLEQAGVPGFKVTKTFLSAQFNPF